MATMEFRNNNNILLDIYAIMLSYVLNFFL